MRRVGWRAAGAALGLTGFVISPMAIGEQLDWDAGMWEPAGPTNLSETFSGITGGDITVTVGNTGDNCAPVPCTALLSALPGVESPGLNDNNTGGVDPAQNSLYIATDYAAPGSGAGPGDQTAPAVSINFVFQGYSDGVGNIEFTIYDLDAAVGFHDDLTVTATTLNGGTVNPTEIISGADNQIVSANGVSGVPGSGSPSNSADGNATFRFEQNAITSITIIYRNIVNQPNPGFQSISISDIDFVPSLPSIDPPIAAFENTTIIGKVFDDRDGDGLQDPGESGVPGVRLITTEGLVIETDAHGRYSIAAVDGGFLDRGRNFIVKVDPATLPAGTVFTTENPRQTRITRGLLNRFDFGVKLPGEGTCCEDVELKLGELFFDTGSAQLRPEYTRVLRQFADRLREHGGGVVSVAGNTTADEVRQERAYTLVSRFDVRDATLKPADREDLDKIADEWRGYRDIRIEVIGHTSNVNIAPQNRQEFADNYELSKARAAAIAYYLRNKMILEPEQMSVDGLGPDQPIASNDTPGGRAKNRRVELRIIGESPVDSTGTGLAEERAKQVYLALKGLLGEEMVRSVDFRFAGDAGEQPAGKPLYAFELLTGQASESMPDDTRFAAADDRRADVRGMFTIALPGGGVMSATEDPVVVEPRLAAAGPPILPVVDGRIDANSVFHLYTNYPAFIKKAELLVYRGDDIDRVRLLARLPVPRTSFARIEWDGDTGGENLEAGEDLCFFIQASDGAGYVDETAPQKINLVARRHYRDPVHTPLIPAVPPASKTAGNGDSSLAAPRAVRSDTPLSGNVLVFQRPDAEPKVDRIDYRLTPRFATRRDVLTDTDRIELNKIVDDWRDAINVRVRAIGHTDNVRIAPEHTDEFANNQVLSEARARRVAQYVADLLDLSEDRISYSGRGPSQPVGCNCESATPDVIARSNATPALRRANRRVELEITGSLLARMDPTRATVILVDPASGAEESVDQSLAEAMNVLAAKRDIEATAGESVRPMRRDDPRAPVLPAQASVEALAALYGRNDLQQQNIPIYGSRVRVHGHDVVGSRGLRIDGHAIPLDADGKFAAEFLMPLGNHNFDVAFLNRAGEITRREALPLEITGEHMFAVAMVDLTLADNDVGRLVEPLAPDSRYADDAIEEGRIAFYLKGRIKGKYLVTAQLDTQEEQLDNLFGNIDKKDPREVFRRIDPDLYYPVYGDDSTTISDTDSQGRLYARIEWDRSEALWGNFNTGITGNEFGQYNRSLYGGQLHYRSIDTTDLGNPKLEGRVFASETQTALGHVEFVGTAGSLYYLKHSEVLPGSDKARVELRDRDSGRILANQALVRDVDYEIDELQGRIILARPLPSITNLIAPGLIRETPLDGNDLVLIVDYEYVPNSFDANQLTSGARGKYWITDKIAVGGTWVDEARPGEDYTLIGGDITLQAGRGTYLKAEFADTESTQTGRFLSADGGLSFSTLLNPVQNRSGDATSIEGRANFAEWLGTEREWVAEAWWRSIDENFSVARRDTGIDTVEAGARFSGELTDRIDIAARFSTIERGNDEIVRIGLQTDYEIGQNGTLSGELRAEQRTQGGTQADATLGAVRYGHRIVPGIELYGIGQFTIDNDPLVRNNDLLTVGATAQVLADARLQGEYSTGHRGDSARVGFDYNLDGVRHVYGTYTHSTDRTDPFGGNQAIIGQSSQINKLTEVFTESQFTRRDDQSGLAHVFGLNFTPAPGWQLGIGLQNGEVVTDIATVDRDAASLSASYENPTLRFGSKIEYRQDKGASQLRQLLSSNRIDYKFSDDLRLLGRLNFSDTSDQLSNADDASFVEGSIGAAFRPAENDRLNILSRYTYLSDLRGPEQVITGTDQRSHIITGEFVYRISNLWDLGSKLGWRRSELRAERSAGEWFESTTNFGALRATFHMLHKWDGIAEFRLLDDDTAANMRQGFLIEVDRHFGQHLKLGLGYNFTEFSDDLTNPELDARGFFFNATGKY